MSKVRAKFACTIIDDQPENEITNVTFNAVMDDSDDNKSFSKWTPSGSISMSISHGTQAHTAFELNKEYYVDFTTATV